MQIHTLQPGSLVEKLIVEVQVLHGVAAAGTYRATVKDATGACSLLYRPGPRCNPSGIRKGHTYSVTGFVAFDHGRLVVEAGGSDGAVEKTHAALPAAAGSLALGMHDYSAAQQLHGVLLLRLLDDQQGGQQQLQAYLLPASSPQQQQQQQGLQLLPGPVPLGLPLSGVFSGRAAACQILEAAAGLSPGCHQLLPLPPLLLEPSSSSSSSSASAGGSAVQQVLLFASMLNGPSSSGSGIVPGRGVGKWVSLPQQQRHDHCQVQQGEGAGSDCCQQHHQHQQHQQQELLPGAWQAAIQQLAQQCRQLPQPGMSSSSSGSPDAQHTHASSNQQQQQQKPAEGSQPVPPPQAPVAPPASGSTNSSSSSSPSGRKKLPVTLLSGFLGAGKTTLLKHLLRNAGGQRIAVVVNDVAALNIDASLIKGGGLVQSQEQLVELQDGCICCSLRVDLVAAIAEMAARSAFDLLLLESTGVSEPLQVAEIFSADVPLDLGAGGSPGAAGVAGGAAAAEAALLLRDVAFLDTAVTVVDAHQLMANLCSIHTFRSDLARQTGHAAAGDGGDSTAAAAAAAQAQAQLSGSQRHIAELLLEQIETANVLLLNKADTVTQQELGLLQAVLSALNPGARLITTTNAAVDPAAVLHTRLWSHEKAQDAPAWVRLLKHDPADSADESSHAHHDAAAASSSHVHTDSCRSSGCCAAGVSGQQPAVAGGLAAPVRSAAGSYGVSHFVYRSRLPFHPERLHDFMVKFFVLQETDWELLMMQQGDDGTEDEESLSSIEEEEEEEEQEGEIEDNTDEVASADDAVGSTAEQLQEVAAGRRAALEQQFGLLLRSKGFVWLATRGDHIGEWSQAGSLLSFTTGGPWFCVLPPGHWPADEPGRASVLSDFAPSVGDRRQELVFIGVGLREAALRAALDACLVSVGEMEGGLARLPDPFEPWPDVADMIDAGESGDEDGDDDEAAPAAVALEPADTQQAAAADAPDTAEDAAAAARAAARAAAAVTWVPGQVNEVTEGAWQLQQLLEDVAEQLGSSSSSSSSSQGPPVLVAWVAPWAEASVAAAQQLPQLAAAFQSLAVVAVDVTASDANRQLALEKVMEVPQAYRKGGRKFPPVPKSGHKWPCASLHTAPLLQPDREFSGPEAGARVMQALQQLGLLTASGKAGMAAAVPAAAPVAGGTRLPPPPPQPKPRQQRRQQSDSSSGSGGSVGSASTQQVQQQPEPQQQQRPQQPKQPVAAGDVHLVKRGAPDMKQLLQLAGPSGVLLLVWTDSSSSAAAEGEGEAEPDMEQLSQLLLQHASTSGRAVVVAAADAAASQANGALAAALKVAVPAVQVFHCRQVAKAVKVAGLAAEAAAAKVTKAVLQLPLSKPPQQQKQKQPSATGLPPPQHQQQPATAEPTAPAASTSNTAATSSSASSSSSGVWDPPPAGTKAAKPGAKKKLPAGVAFRPAGGTRAAAAGVSAVFWPRMPCLSCGCPWWLGEDWDATCARCGWSCEEGGYDDDSNPLPQHRARYELIVARLAQGSTPEGLERLQQSD